MTSELIQSMASREKLILEALAQVHGMPAAEAASNAMWMQILCNLAEHMARVQQKYISDPVARVVAAEELENMVQDFDFIAQSVHQSVCLLLGVSPAKALELFPHFKELMRDALNLHRRT